MAHFAQLDENNIVISVVVINNEDCVDADGNESESVGVNFCKSLFGADTIWKQTSYNSNIRKNFAVIGATYDISRDAFISPQPYASWTLDDTTCLWESPISKPTLTQAQIDAGSYYTWDEAAYNLDNTQGWVLVE